MGFIPTLFLHSGVKIDSFGAFLQDSRLPTSSDENKTIHNRFSWIIDTSKNEKLDKYDNTTGKLRIIKCGDPEWDTLNPIIMDKHIQRKAINQLIEMKEKEDEDKKPVTKTCCYQFWNFIPKQCRCRCWCWKKLDKEKKECQYYLYDTREIQVKTNLLKLYQKPEWFLDVEWREAHPCLKECPRLKSFHKQTKTYC